MSDQSRSIYDEYQINSPTYYQTDSTNALTTEAPTTTHPILIICGLLSIVFAVNEETVYLAPAKTWNVNGHAIQNFAKILAATGSAPNAATMLVVERSHPSSGAAT
ncbi:hypothetical protein FQN49_005093 [Arthroderma sp. PD_2]|nr:hypothetical protein FQN49_005093 [Arthroderma sp. PD_2]